MSQNRINKNYLRAKVVKKFFNQKISKRDFLSLMFLFLIFPKIYLSNSKRTEKIIWITSPNDFK
jgi:hypothetical protein